MIFDLDFRRQYSELRNSEPGEMLQGLRVRFPVPCQAAHPPVTPALGESDAAGLYGEPVLT